jgi:hypothetical protein
LTYDSVDALQKTLADEVFQYATDRKKAAGRALGTLVELVTFYTLRAWDLRDHTVIERSVPEYGNSQVAHNVEFSLHPIRRRHDLTVSTEKLPVTPAKIAKEIPQLPPGERKANHLLSTNGVQRNACIIGEGSEGPIVAHVNDLSEIACELTVCELFADPFAIFECKRVGVEEGMKKGPQTIEKAKQGAYVASSVSSLQKIRLRDGSFSGVIERSDGSLHTRPYGELIREIVDGSDRTLLDGFILTVGVVSNHGNWFTSTDQNKELKVLAQSYDWLLFLTDSGLAQFIEELLLNPTPELEAARSAFLKSYSGSQGNNRFTKVKMDLKADKALRQYFRNHEDEVESWYNVISPSDSDITGLRANLQRMADKDWASILNE